ncbi:MAG TPA: NAD(P)H-hydrate dehydratase [Blastocatellia bacterium]|nr:NAD(P)H-hydrate dehydratase [Blastocatellia bacterium]
MKVLTADQMREVDRATIEQYGVPGIQLMETAASRTVEIAEASFGPFDGKSALVICGRGNNGGDGAAIARLIHTRGASVLLLLLGCVEDARGDARENFETALQIASSNSDSFRLIEIETSEQLKREAAARAHDVMFDAILGTGLARPATGLFQEAIELLNDYARRSPLIAVDVPSGLASDSHDLIGPAIKAHLTVTFTAPKPASVLPPASDYNGELVVADIGSPGELIRAAGSKLNLVEPEMISAWLAASRRQPTANKGDVGKVLIIAGSRGKTGAACLAGEAALRSGCGLVTIATPASSQPVVAARALTECMTEPLAETESGAVAREASDRAMELAAARDIVAIGPGLGSAEESTRDFVRLVVSRIARPMVIDADGLNALAPWTERFGGSAESLLILTPHPGEMSRLVDKPVVEVVRNRVAIARDFATQSKAILVLKGSRSLIAAPDGEVYVNPTGNPGMASGGTGDVLTGMIAGLIAQKPDDPIHSVVAAVYLHGLAGDIAAEWRGTRSMLASDITAMLGRAFIEVGGKDEGLTRKPL